MLTRGQKMELERYYAKEYQEPVHIIVKIGSYRPYTREFGKGFPVYVFIQYLADGEKDLKKNIALCQYDYTALDKAKEIARYLRDDLNLGEIVKLRK